MRWTHTHGCACPLRAKPAAITAWRMPKEINRLNNIHKGCRSVILPFLTFFSMDDIALESAVGCLCMSVPLWKMSVQDGTEFNYSTLDVFQPLAEWVILLYTQGYFYSLFAAETGDHAV